MSRSEGFDEEKVKDELLALTRELLRRQPLNTDSRYKKGWRDLYSLYAAVISASGFRLPPDVWRSMLDEMSEPAEPRG